MPEPKAWVGSVGRLALIGNARGEKAAAVAALSRCADRVFPVQRIITEAEFESLSAEEERAKSWRPDSKDAREGAWEVRLLRIGHAVMGKIEHANEFRVESATRLSCRPAQSPDFQDDPGHWSAALLAAREAEALACAARGADALDPAGRRAAL